MPSLKMLGLQAAAVLLILLSGRVEAKEPLGPEFPPELVDFVPAAVNPVFTASNGQAWDSKIRERGFILREADGYHLWYTGYNPALSDTKYLGYATSADGVHWTRYAGNPIFTEKWTEDVQVVKHGDTYYMVAEGRADIAHLLTSKDRIHWTEQGDLDIRYANGKPLSPGSYGTPVLWVEGANWYLFYERGDRAVWLARSRDRKVWTNVQDDPVIVPGPEPYDRQAIAWDQVIKVQGRYYGYYHATGQKPWGNWNSNVAMSTDLVHWKKYPKNPIVAGDKSSPVVVRDGRQWRLYTMHPDVRLYLPRGVQP
jgi:sucrose-6-phosphate hydrolase SacC (GH32 family)